MCVAFWLNRLLQCYFFLFAGPFRNNTGGISDKYNTEITPSGWTFSIWGVIYTWLSLMHVYILTTTCRRYELSELESNGYQKIKWQEMWFCNNNMLHLMIPFCILLSQDCLWSNVLQSPCVAVWILHNLDCKHAAKYNLAFSVGQTVSLCHFKNNCDVLWKPNVFILKILKYYWSLMHVCIYCI